MTGAVLTSLVPELSESSLLFVIQGRLPSSTPLAPPPPRSSLPPPCTVRAKVGWGVGFPGGIGFAVLLLFIKGEHMDPLQPVGCALDLPLGLVWGSLFLAALTSGSSRFLTPGGCLSSSRYGCLVDGGLKRRLLTMMAILDTLVA